MIEETIVRLCAPTLAGIKTGSLFSYSYSKKDDMFLKISSLNKRLSHKGLQFTVLRCANGKALIYVYRPNRLKQDLKKRIVQDMLKKSGYDCESCDRCIQYLIRRIRSSDDFPHEIGLFLSYPPKDVLGFIENNAADYKFTGYWKVYGDEKFAKKTFKKYKVCTNIYCSRKRQGFRLEELTVAV